MSWAVGLYLGPIGPGGGAGLDRVLATPVSIPVPVISPAESV